MTGPALPAAVLWDFDGTLVDTEPQWMAAESRFAGRFGVEWTVEDADALVGRDLLTSGRYIRDRTGLALSPEAIVDELLDEMVVSVDAGVETRPGALGLLECLRAQGIPCALVTMSYRRLVDPVLHRLGLLASFAVVVCGEDVTRGKPHPEAYLKAARDLGVEPQRCIAIEDSVNGAISAQAAGCQVVVIPNRVAVPPAAGRTILQTLDGLNVPRLVAAAAARPAQTRG